MHSKRRYKICICLVTLGDLEAFRKLQGRQCSFPETFICNWTFYESENFFYFSLHHTFEFENFRLPFIYEN